MGGITACCDSDQAQPPKLDVRPIEKKQNANIAGVMEEEDTTAQPKTTQAQAKTETISIEYF